MARTATITRNTAETKISLSLALDGAGKADIQTGLGFFDHMLTLLAGHSLFDLTVRCDGDLHVDGGAFNNFPVDVMYRRGAAVVIGVSLPREVTPKIELDEVPSLWQTLVGAFRGLKSELPSLTTVLFNAAMINSLARQSQARGQIDLWFQPPVLEFDILDWKRFDELVANGLAHGQEVLAGLSEPLRRKLQGQSIGDAKAVDR